MAHKLCCDISDDLRQALAFGNGGAFIDDWKRANAYACRYQDENVILNAQVKRLEAELQEEKKDAERYRWLKQNHDINWYAKWFLKNETDFGEEIDAALARSTGKA